VVTDESTYPDADADVADGRTAPSARKPLSKARVIDTAVAFIDEHGLAGLTMRRLGESLGVEAMALYRHVPGRDELLDGIVARLTEEVDADAEVLKVPRDGWQDFLQRLGHGVRRVALTHPKVFPLVASRPVEAPWLRPPLRSLDWVERFLDGLLAEGFKEDDAVGAYRAFTSFLLGHLLLEVSTHGAEVGPLDVLEEDGQPERLSGFPTVARLRPALSEDHSAVEFEDALESLIERISLMQSSKAP
jgi:AcrR family transcriptional regulator